MSAPLVRGARAIRRLPALVLIGLIRAYQLIVSPWLGPTCRYYPSCSAYGLQAVRTHGALVGFALAAWRVLRCNPFSHGGIDEVPPVGSSLFRRRAGGAVTSPTSSATQ